MDRIWAIEVGVYSLNLFKAHTYWVFLLILPAYTVIFIYRENILIDKLSVSFCICVHECSCLWGSGGGVYGDWHKYLCKWPLRPEDNHKHCTSEAVHHDFWIFGEFSSGQSYLCRLYFLACGAPSPCLHVLATNFCLGCQLHWQQHSANFCRPLCQIIQ